MHTFKLSIDLEELEFDKIKYCKMLSNNWFVLSMRPFLVLGCFYIFLKVDSIHYINRVYKVGRVIIVKMYLVYFSHYQKEY